MRSPLDCCILAIVDRHKDNPSKKRQKDTEEAGLDEQEEDEPDATEEQEGEKAAPAPKAKKRKKKKTR